MFFPPFPDSAIPFHSTIPFLFHSIHSGHCYSTLPIPDTVIPLQKSHPNSNLLSLWIPFLPISLFLPFSPFLPVQSSVGEVWFETDSNLVWTKPKPSSWFPVWEIFAKLNGLVSGFGLLKFLKRFQIRFKPQTVCNYNFFIATVNCFVVYLILIYIYYINFEVYLLILYLIYL